MPFQGWPEGLRAAFGALLGVGLAAVISALTGGGLAMIAPFGATAVLVFAVPNSPLAQPWSAVAGNTVSALAGVAVVLALPDPALRMAAATGLAILAMHLARALHPPGGAVALTAALNPDMVQDMGLRFALLPVAAGTLLLVLAAVAYARATGRHYPFRQAAQTNAHGTTDARAVERLAVSRGELAGLLRDFNQSQNIGVEDLARMIAAAEAIATAHRLEGVTSADIMSRDLVTVGPQAPLSEVAEIFRRHGFTSLPVVGADNRFLGVIFQIHLIRRGRDDAQRLGRGFAAAMGRLLDRGRSHPPTAQDIMSVTVPRVTAHAPLSALLPYLAEGDCDAVPVLEHGRLIGIVTRTDLIAALARQAG